MCKPMEYPVSLGVSVKSESHRLFQIYLQLLPTNTSHWGNGLRVPASPIAHISTWGIPPFPLLSTDFSSSSSSSQAESKFISKPYILVPAYFSISVYRQRKLSPESLFKETIVTGKDPQLFSPSLSRFGYAHCIQFKDIQCRFIPPNLSFSLIAFSFKLTYLSCTQTHPPWKHA